MKIDIASVGNFCVFLYPSSFRFIFSFFFAPPITLYHYSHVFKSHPGMSSFRTNFHSPVELLLC